MRKSLALCLLVLAFVATNAFAGAESRMSGKVLDAATKKPIPNAKITLEAIEGKTFKTDLKTNSAGEFAVFVLDGTIRYKYTVEADGYVGYQEVVKMALGTSKRDFVLTKVGDAPAAVTSGGAPAKADPAVDAYNAGADLANAGNHAAAVAKFEEAVKAKPDLTVAWIALAKLSAKTKNWPRAIEAANKVLEVDDEDTDMYAVLSQAYEATGDKAKAAAAQAKLPKNAGQLFNDAAKLINGGNDAEGEKLLKQAIAADDTMAVAYYELGMIYVRAGKSAEAKSSLEKYLSLEPNGKDAPTAKEMLSYLK